MTPVDLRDHCILARFPSGGVVVNLDTGNYFRVDLFASQICEVLIDLDVSDPSGEIARRLKIPLERAEIAIAETCTALAVAPARGRPPGPFHFLPESTGYGLWHAGKRVLTVSSVDLEISIASDGEATQSPLLEMYVRALAPKIMFLRGLSVIHASACATESALVAFAGLSGAGKTTTARSFAAAGATLVAEDLVVLKPGLSRPSLARGAETRVHSWAKTIADRLARGASRVSSQELAAMADGDGTDINAICFLDARRRQGTKFQFRALSGPEGLLSLMTHDFLGDASREGWRRFFNTAVLMAAGTRLLETTTPLGLDYLPAAAKRQMSNWISYGFAGDVRSPNQA
jgi:hypothetical protein